MRIEIAIDRKKMLPDGVAPALEVGLKRRLGLEYEGCELSIRRAGDDGLSVLGDMEGDRVDIEEDLTGNVGNRRRLVLLSFSAAIDRFF